MSGAIATREPIAPLERLPPRSLRRPILVVTLLLAAVAIGSWLVPNAAAHAQLVTSSPPADALLEIPPRQIELTMSERVAAVAGSPSLKVLDETGRAMQTDPASVDPANATRITASVSGIGTGTFTVVWSATSADDGHTEQGTFAFRVGGTDRAPGAATTEGQRPRLWAIATRWLTFFGAGIAGAAFLFRAMKLFGVDPQSPGERRRLRIAAAAAVIGLLATAAEPLLQRQFPAVGMSKPSMQDSISALPSAWWLRAPGLAVAAALALALLRLRGKRRPSERMALIGTAAGLAAILGLALTTHAAARTHLRIPAIISIVAHEWAAALWVGGLVCLAVSLPGRSDEGQSDRPLRMFSRFAMVMFGIAGTAGLVNAGLAFPTVNSVWTSDFGWVLIAKTAILVPALALASWHWRTIRTVAERFGHLVRMTVRLEAGLVALVVLGGATLALVAPPLKQTAGGTAAAADLAAPLSGQDGRYLRFELSPAKPGANAITAFVTDGVPVAYDPTTNGMVAKPALPDIVMIRLTLTSLDHDAPPVQSDLVATGGGVFAASGVQFSLTNWWQVDATVRRLGVGDQTATIVVMLPDPNVNGFDAPKTPTSDPSAESLFQQGLTSLTSLHSAHYTENLAGGIGTLVLSDQRLRDDSNGQPAAVQIISAGTSIIHMRGEEWVRAGDGKWQGSDAGPVATFSTWGDDFKGATGFQLGGIFEVNGKQTRLISFYVPGTTLAPAWYAWWVSVDSGEIMRQTMVSRGHYMKRDFLEINTPQDINPPVSQPGASPTVQTSATPAP